MDFAKFATAKTTQDYIDAITSHPATPFVVMPAVGALGGLGINELLNLPTRIAGRKIDPEDDKRQRRRSLAVGAGVGLGMASRPHIDPIIKKIWEAGGGVAAKEKQLREYLSDSIRG